MATIQNFLANSVLKRAAVLKKQTMKLTSLLPAQFIGHCQVAEISGEHITIAVSSPAWSSQLRYYLPSIKKSFPYQHIRILVSPEMSGVFQLEAQSQPRQLDDLAASQISSTAENITDPKLKNAMLRLAQHGVSKKAKDS